MGYLDNAGLSRFWDDIKTALFGPGKFTTSSDDANTLPKGVYSWLDASSKPANVPADISSAVLIVLTGSSAMASTVQIVIPSVSTALDARIYYRYYVNLVGWNGWSKLAAASDLDSAIANLELGSASKRNVTTSVTSGSSNLLTSGGAYTNIPHVSLRRGTEITSTASSPANFNDYTSAGRYYTTVAAATNSILNSPTKALGADSSGKFIIDGTQVTFNASLELIVEELSQLYDTQSGTITDTYIMQTVIYSYNSASTGTAPTIGRNFARSRIFRRMKDHAGWSNWHMYTGTEIVPPAT